MKRNKVFNLFSLSKTFYWKLSKNSIVERIQGIIYLTHVMNDSLECKNVLVFVIIIIIIILLFKSVHCHGWGMNVTNNCSVPGWTLDSFIYTQNGSYNQLFDLLDSRCSNFKLVLNHLQKLYYYYYCYDFWYFSF